MSYSKILLYGPGNAGKSTILKQILYSRLLYLNEEEQSAFMKKNFGGSRPIAIRNMIDSVQILCEEVQFLEPESKHLIEKIPARNSKPKWSKITFNQAEVIQNLWGNENSPGLLQRIWLQRHAFRPNNKFIHDNTEHFLPKAQLIVNEENEFVGDDIMHCREQTQDIVVLAVPWQTVKAGTTNTENFVLQIMDVGGQKASLTEYEAMPEYRDYRTKASIVFVAIPVGEYDMVREGGNNLERGFEMLEEIANYSATVKPKCWRYCNSEEDNRQKMIVVFLTKVDILECKVKAGGSGLPIRESWPDQENPWIKDEYFALGSSEVRYPKYEGDPHNADAILKYFETRCRTILNDAGHNSLGLTKECTAVIVDQMSPLLNNLLNELMVVALKNFGFVETQICRSCGNYTRSEPTMPVCINNKCSKFRKILEQKPTSMQCAECERGLFKVCCNPTCSDYYATGGKFDVNEEKCTKCNYEFESFVCKDPACELFQTFQPLIGQKTTWCCWLEDVFRGDPDLVARQKQISRYKKYQHVTFEEGKAPQQGPQINPMQQSRSVEKRASQMVEMGSTY